MENKITVIQLDDWSVLYGPDGEKITEDHQISYEDMFNALQNIDIHPKLLEIDYEYFEGDIVDDLFDGETPQRLSIIRDYNKK